MVVELYQTSPMMASPRATELELLLTELLLTELLLTELLLMELLLTELLLFDGTPPQPANNVAATTNASGLITAFKFKFARQMLYITISKSL